MVVENYSNGELGKITAWAACNKVRFNDEKSKVMLVTRRKRKESRAIKVYLNNKPLEQVTTMKYLGIILDHKFTFKDHISYAAERCATLIHSLSRSAKVTWGIKHEALKTIYKGAILPLLLYGAPVWIDAMQYEYNQRKYIRVQRMINILTAKAFRTTSTEALCILAGITPIIIKAEEAAKMYHARKTKPSHSQEIDNTLDYKDWPHPADYPTITISEDNKSPIIQAYTDGSKSEHGVGSGAAIFIGTKIAAQIKFKLDKRCSNNQAEQLAIIKALESIYTLNTEESNPRTATVYTDSRLTIDSLRNPDNHAYLIEEIRRRVAKLQGANWKIEFSWVKAHAGIHGNELADKLAKEAARNEHTDVAFRRIPISTLHQEIQQESIQRWQKEWENCTKAAITKEYFPTIQEKLKTKMRDTQNIAAMITGHGKTRAYLHKFKILENATCPCEQGDQTIDHLFYQCTLLEPQRQKTKKNVIKDGHWPASKQQLITKHRDSFLTFLESIDFDHL